MSVEFTVAQLLTAGGCGAATLALLQFLGKPLLNGIVSGSPQFERWRALAVNLSALVISVTLAFLAQAIPGITYETGLQAFLTGLGGALIAVGGYEGIKNAGTALSLR